MNKGKNIKFSYEIHSFPNTIYTFVLPIQQERDTRGRGYYGRITLKKRFPFDHRSLAESSLDRLGIPNVASAHAGGLMITAYN